MKQNVLFLLIIIIFYSCKTSKNRIQNNSNSKEETIVKKESTKQLVDFFNAENARLLGKNSESITLYNNFIKKYPTNATANFNLAKVYFKIKQLDDAVKFAKYACKLSPENIYFQEFYTSLLVYNNKYPLAENQYEILIDKNPNKPEYLFKKAQLYLKNKDYSKAIKCLNQFEAKVGYNEDIIMQKKYLYTKTGQHNLAINEVNKLLLENPSDISLHLMKSEIYLLDNKKESSDSVFKYIETHFENDAIAQEALINYYLSKNNKNKYNHYLLKLTKNKNISEDTKVSIILPVLLDLEANQNDSDGFKLDLTKQLLNEAPNNKDAILLSAQLFLNSSKLTESINLYNRYIKIDKSRLDVWLQLASLYLEQKKIDSTIFICTEAQNYFNESPSIYFYKGLAYMQNNEFENSINSYQTALQFENNNTEFKAQIYSALGDTYNTVKKYNLSDSIFDEALKSFPKDATILNNYAYYLSVRIERLEDAERMSKLSLEIQPNSKSFLDTYGWILYQQGKFEDAKIYIDKAIKSKGDDDGTLFEHLGDVYYKLNDFKKAKEYWQLAIDKGENNSILLQKLKTGKINE